MENKEIRKKLKGRVCIYSDYIHLEFSNEKNIVGWIARAQKVVPELKSFSDKEKVEVEITIKRIEEK